MPEIGLLQVRVEARDLDPHLAEGLAHLVAEDARRPNARTGTMLIAASAMRTSMVKIT